MRKTNIKTNKKNIHPAFVTGIVCFEFWNNEDESYRNKSLKNLASEIRKNLNISSIPILPETDTESGEIAFAGIALNKAAAESLAKSTMDFLDRHAPARMVNDSWLVEEFPA